MKNIHFIDLNNCLRKYRRARGFRQKDVARILGLRGTSMISRWEKGGCIPDSINIFRLSILYRTMADALFIDLVKRLREEMRKKEEEVMKLEHR